MNQMLLNMLKHMLPTSGDYRVIFYEAHEANSSSIASRWRLEIKVTATDQCIFIADFAIPKE